MTWVSKLNLMSLAHMRGPAGAIAILNAADSGRLRLGVRGAESLDPEATNRLNSLTRAEAVRRIMVARTAYDQHVMGPDYWNRFGTGLADRYAREREFYANL
jgi:type VI secretion system secreted protein VgrG